MALYWRGGLPVRTRDRGISVPSIFRPFWALSFSSPGGNYSFLYWVSMAAQLQKEGAESFVKSWDEMMDVVAKKAQV